jgi:aminopeptidase N
LKVFNKTFGEYPYAEFDVAENPTPSGVEFPGLVQITERAWVQGNGYLEIVIAHEVGHQWFYAMVGNNQVEQPWLDESLTAYTEFVYVREYFDARRADDYVSAFRRRYTSFTGAGQADQPLSLPVTGYSGMAYGAIVYTKGPLFMVELERLIGRDTVYAALAEYFNRERYRIAVAADLKRAIEDVSGQEIF